MNFIYFRPQLFLVLILGLLSGLPLALTMSTATTMLKDSGVDIATIGLFALTGLPYAFKFLWAPLVDNLQIPFLYKKLGRRRSWLVIMQVILGAIVFAISLLNPNQHLEIIALLTFLIAVSSATLDIVVDAFRIEKLSPEEQGAGASMYIAGYRIGMLISTAGALYVAHFIDWSAAYVMLASVYVLGILAILATKEPSSYKESKKASDPLSWALKSYFEPIKDILLKKNVFAIIIFIVLYKLSDAYAGALTSPFLLEIGFSKLEIANIVKFIGLIATLTGALSGGYLVSKIGMAKSLLLGGILQILSNLFFVLQARVGYNQELLTVVMFIENFSGGIGTAAFVAYLSNLCNLQFTATQYAVFSSLSSVARTTLSSSSGFLQKAVGWEMFFMISALLSIPALFLISIITKPSKLERVQAAPKPLSA